MKINSIKSAVESRIKEKSSLFIGKAFPIKSQIEIEQIFQQLKVEFSDANHICFAWKLHPNFEKYSDDGEPNGSAGVRLLNAINHFQLQNTLLVSIRYFGGIKLGVGFLGKTYYQNGIETLQFCEIVEEIEFGKLIINYNYEQSKTVHHFLEKFKAKIIQNEYLNNPIIHALIAIEVIHQFESELKLALNNNINIISDKSTFFQSKT